MFEPSTTFNGDLIIICNRGKTIEKTIDVIAMVAWKKYINHSIVSEKLTIVKV